MRARRIQRRWRVNEVQPHLKYTSSDHLNYVLLPRCVACKCCCRRPQKNDEIESRFDFLPDHRVDDPDPAKLADNSILHATLQTSNVRHQVLDSNLGVDPAAHFLRLHIRPITFLLPDTLAYCKVTKKLSQEKTDNWDFNCPHHTLVLPFTLDSRLNVRLL